jgi:hypothetical protein
MRRIVVPLLVPTVVIVVAACRDPEPDTAVDGTATTSSLATPTTTATSTLGEEGAAPAPPPPESDEEAVVAAVVGYWDAVIAAGVSGDASELSTHATGEALDVSSRRTVDLVQLGQSLRVPERSLRHHSPVVVEISADTASVLDCSIDDTVVFDHASGRVLNDAVQTNEWLTTVRRVDGAWKVEGNVLQGQWAGVAGCAG